MDSWPWLASALAFQCQGDLKLGSILPFIQDRVEEAYFLIVSQQLLFIQVM